MPKDTLALQAEQRILILRNQKVMLDFHLAELYGVETRALKQAVRRNPERFPEDFMFELTMEEARLLVSQTVIPGLGKLGGAVPMAFTEQGVAMLSSVLRGERAVQVNIAIMRTFVDLRRLMDSNAPLAEVSFISASQHFRISAFSSRTRISHHSIRTFRQKEETLNSTMRIPPTATTRPNLRSARIVNGRSWIADAQGGAHAHAPTEEGLMIANCRLLIFEVTKRHLFLSQSKIQNQQSSITNPSSPGGAPSPRAHADGTGTNRQSLPHPPLPLSASQSFSFSAFTPMSAANSNSPPTAPSSANLSYLTHGTRTQSIQDYRAPYQGVVGQRSADASTAKFNGQDDIFILHFR